MCPGCTEVAAYCQPAIRAGKYIIAPRLEGNPISVRASRARSPLRRIDGRRPQPSVTAINASPDPPAIDGPAVPHCRGDDNRIDRRRILHIEQAKWRQPVQMNPGGPAIDRTKQSA